MRSGLTCPIWLEPSSPQRGAPPLCGITWHHQLCKWPELQPTAPPFFTRRRWRRPDSVVLCHTLVQDGPLPQSFERGLTVLSSIISSAAARDDDKKCLVDNVSVRGSFSAKVPRSSFARVRRVLVLHMEEEGEEQENEQEDERENGKQRVERRVVESIKTTISWTHEDGMKWSARHTPNLSQCQCDIKMCAVKHENMWRVRCAVHTPRRLQQIAISCKRSDHNKLKNLVKVSLWAA